MKNTGSKISISIIFYRMIRMSSVIKILNIQSKFKFPSELKRSCAEHDNTINFRIVKKRICETVFLRKCHDHVIAYFIYYWQARRLSRSPDESVRSKSIGEKAETI